MAGLFALTAACATQTPTRTPTPTPQPAPTPAYEAGVELPPGNGREILVAACLSCHNLGGLELFKGFYTRDSWHALVVTMVAHGAQMSDAEVETLADYLAQHFGPE